MDDPPAVRRLPATKGVFQFAEETVRAQRTARLRILAESRLEFQVDHTVILHNEDILAVISALGDVVRPSRNDYSGKSRHEAMEQKGTDPSEARNERRRVCALSCGHNDITLLYS